MSAESIFPLELDAVMEAVARLPPFPEVALQLLQSLDGADADSEQLERLIATDQILTARLLRVANSSFYGMQGRIHSIRDALVLIGYRGLRSLAIAASLSSALPGEGGQPGGFWRQGLAAGVVAQVLGRAAHLNPDDPLDPANRRISIVVLNKAAEEAMRAPGRQIEVEGAGAPGAREPDGGDAVVSDIFGAPLR